jgi:NADPH:quinone reductase-like Zn-dependent oxidoreductase
MVRADTAPRSACVKEAMRDRYGGPEVVSIREVDKPAPGEGEVLVRVEAASVNRADLDGLYPRWAFTRLLLGLRAPKGHNRYVGIDVCGVVEAVGEAVDSLKIGDTVFSDLSATYRGSGGGASTQMCGATSSASCCISSSCSPYASIGR